MGSEERRRMELEIRIEKLTRLIEEAREKGDMGEVVRLRNERAKLRRMLDGFED